MNEAESITISTPMRLVAKQKPGVDVTVACAQPKDNAVDILDKNVIGELKESDALDRGNEVGDGTGTAAESKLPAN